MPLSKRQLSVFLGVFVACAGNAVAQSVRGSLAGNVTDPTGAVIPAAKIAATNSGTGLTSNTVSSSAGSFRFPDLPLGPYDVTVSATGFQSAAFKGVLVQIQNTTALDVKLQPGTTTQTVTVDANAPTIETESSDIGGIVSDRQIIQLPLALGGVGALRSPEAFEFLLPGTTGPGTANSNNGIFLSKIAGGQNYGNEVLIDGASQTRSENGSSFDEEAPSVEALQEFKITTAIPEAEYGRTTGGIENFVTKSGTNRFHGAAFDIFRNEDLDANTWFNNGKRAINCIGTNDTAACRATYKRPQDKQNDYGVSLGGPVRIPHVYNGRDKMFFFFSWEQFQQNLGAVNNSSVPTLAERGGDFSSPQIYRTDLPPLGANPCDGTPVYQGEIFDPATTRTVNGSACRTQFPGNKINPARFSAVAKNILNYYPLPTNGGQINNFDFPSTIPINNTTETIRVDDSITQKSKIFGSYSSRENNRTSGGNPTLPYPEDPTTWKQDFITHLGRAGWDYSISDNLLNHFNAGYNRTNSQNYDFAIFQKIDWTSKLGIQNAPASLNFPQVTTNGGAATGEAGLRNLGNPAQNDDNIDNGIRLDDSVAWQHGRNSFKFGVDYRFQQYSPINQPTPAVQFCRAQTASDPTQTGNSGNGIASLLLGDVCGGNFGAGLIAHQSRWSSQYYALFAQDDLKVSNNLTLNLGMRWSVDAPRHEAQNYTSNFSKTAMDPQYGIPGALVFATTCKGCNTAWADTYYKDFSPRVGFAYQPPNSHGNTVFRGGGAIFYGPLQYGDFGGSMNQGYKVAPNFPSPDGFSPSFALDSGYTAYGQPPNLNPGFFHGQPVTGSYIGKGYGEPAKVYEWDVQMQQQLTQDLILTVGYVGNKTQNLRSNVQNINNIPINDFALGGGLTQHVIGNTLGVQQPFTGFTQLWGNGVQVQQALRPFPQYQYVDTGCCLQNVGMSSYNALLVSLARRYRNGLSLQLSYTWAKDITDADSALPNNGVAVSQVQNPFNLHMEKAISAQDLPQTLVLSWLYDLPFGKGKKWLNHGVTSYALGGWELGGVQRYENGQPLSFCCASGIPGWDNSIYYSRVPGRSLASAAYRKGQLNPLGSNNSSLFNTTVDRDSANGAFIDLNEPRYRNGGAFVFGNVPRVTGEVRTPLFLNEDVSLLKTTPITEGVSFVLKFEFLNATNRHAWSIPPDLNPNDNAFGVPTGTVTTPRNMQITGRITF